MLNKGLRKNKKGQLAKKLELSFVVELRGVEPRSGDGTVTLSSC